MSPKNRSIQVYSEGDAIAIAYDQTSSRPHSSDLSDIGQRLGFISITELHDPAMQDTLRQRLKGYFSTVDIDTMKASALHCEGAYIASYAIQSAGNLESFLMSMQRLLEDSPASKRHDKVRSMLIKSLEQEGISAAPEQFRTSLLKYSQDKKTNIGKVVDNILSTVRAKMFVEFSDDLQGHGRNIKKALEEVVTADEKERARKPAMEAEFHTLCHFIPAEERKVAWERYQAADDKDKGKTLKEFLQKHAAPLKKDDLLKIYDLWSDASTRHGKPFVFSLDEIVTFKMVERAQAMKAEPEKYADEMLADMRSKMDKDYKPLTTEQQRECKKLTDAFHATLAQAPEIIREGAAAAGLTAVIAKEGSNIKAIKPNRGLSDNMNFSFLTQYIGLSTDTAIYLTAKTVNDPGTTIEESAHHVDRALGPFTLRPEWRKAVDKDLTDMKANKLAQQLAKLVTHDAKGLPTKANTCFARPRYEHETYLEALPDIVEMERQVKHQIAQKGKFKTGMFSSLGSVDDVMNKAYPNMWKLYKGPSQGHELMQQADGSVTETPSRTAKDKVISFTQACRDLIDGKSNPDIAVADDTSSERRSDWSHQSRSRSTSSLAFSK